MGMSLWKKIVLFLLSAVFLLAVSLVAVFLFWLGPATRGLVEYLGPKALGCRVEMDLLAIDPRQGTLELRGLRVGNPAGFSKTNLLSVAALRLSIDPRSLFSDSVVVRSIALDSPRFAFEENGETDNLSELARNFHSFAGVDRNRPKKDKPKEPSKRVVVESFVVNGAQVLLAHTLHPELDVSLDLGHLAFGTTDGLLRMDRLALGNPTLLGGEPRAASIGSIQVRVDPDSFRGGPFAIEGVRVVKPRVWYGRNGENDTLSVFAQIIGSFGKSGPSGETTEAKAKSSGKGIPPGVPQKLSIDDFRFRFSDAADPELNPSIHLGKLEVDPREGTLALRNLSVGNLSSLASSNLLEVAAANLKLEPHSLHSGKPRIENLQVSSPRIFLEENSKTDTVAEWTRFVRRLFASSGDAGSAARPSKKAENSSPAVELDNLRIGDTRIMLLDTTQTNAPSAPWTLATVGRFSARPMRGHFRIDRVVLPNPPGFSRTNLFQLGCLQVDLDSGPGLRGPAHIREILVGSPRLWIEQTETSGNLGALAETVGGFIRKEGRSRPGKKELPAAGKGVPADAPPVAFDSLLVTNLAIHVMAPAATNWMGGDLAGGRRRDRVNSRRRSMWAAKRASLMLLDFERLSIEPAKGMMEISNLEIGNPAGSSYRRLATVQSCRMDFDSSSIRKNPFVIEDILVEKPRISYERKARTDNFRMLGKFVGSLVQRGKVRMGAPDAFVGPPVPGAEPVPPEPEGRKVVIRHLEVSEGLVRAKIANLPSVPLIPLRFELDGLGEGSGGVSAREVSGKIFASFYDATISAVGNVSGGGDALPGKKRREARQTADPNSKPGFFRRLFKPAPQENPQ